MGFGLLCVHPYWFLVVMKCCVNMGQVPMAVILATGEDYVSRPAQAKSLQGPISKIITAK
jgi:hypothetical protein